MLDIAATTGNTHEHQRELDRRVKRKRLITILDEVGADGLVLTSPGATSWYLDGARTQVALLGPAVVEIEIDRTGDVVHVPDNEASRMLAEELTDDMVVRAQPWHRWGAERHSGLIAESAVEVQLRAARAELLPGELARYRGLCHDASQILTAAFGDATPATTERQLAARVAHDTTAIGAEPVVLMAAGDSRLHHRHPLPTDAPIGRRCMLVLGARRHGMITNLTRWVRFGSQTAAEADPARALLEVEAEFFAATRPGALVSDAFDRGCGAYARHGFRADEWERHHQGGVAGYNGRDPRATAGLPDVFADNGVVSWNPSAPSSKVEDTVLVTSAGLEVLTADAAWPTTKVGDLARPLELER